MKVTFYLQFLCIFSGFCFYFSFLWFTSREVDEVTENPKKESNNWGGTHPVDKVGKRCRKKIRIWVLNIFWLTVNNWCFNSRVNWRSLLSTHTHEITENTHYCFKLFDCVINIVQHYAVIVLQKTICLSILLYGPESSKIFTKVFKLRFMNFILLTWTFSTPWGIILVVDIKEK